MYIYIYCVIQGRIISEHVISHSNEWIFLSGIMWVGLTLWPPCFSSQVSARLAFSAGAFGLKCLFLFILQSHVFNYVCECVRCEPQLFSKNATQQPDQNLFHQTWFLDVCGFFVDEVRHVKSRVAVLLFALYTSSDTLCVETPSQATPASTENSCMYEYMCY